MPSRKFDKYAITVSPPCDSNKVLDLFVQKFMSRQSTKYVYVFEYGHDGKHKHLHLYTELNVCKRKYDFEQSCLKFLHKSAELDDKYDNVLLNVKYANRPMYWVREYLEKELQPTYVGLDKTLIEKENELLEKIDKANMKKRLFRHQFLTLYDYIKKDIQGADYSTSDYYLKVCTAVDGLGFDTSPLLQHPRVYRRLILFYERNNQPSNLITINDLISIEFKREENLQV